MLHIKKTNEKKKCRKVNIKSQVTGKTFHNIGRLKQAYRKTKIYDGEKIIEIETVELLLTDVMAIVADRQENLEFNLNDSNLEMNNIHYKYENKYTQYKIKDYRTN